jgi:hypothetical protein
LLQQIKASNGFSPLFCLAKNGEPLMISTMAVVVPIAIGIARLFVSALSLAPHPFSLHHQAIPPAAE